MSTLLDTTVSREDILTLELDNEKSPIDRELLEIYGVNFDSEGNPIWYSHENIFDELARKLLAHYGEAIRQPLNESLSDHGLLTL